MGDQDQSQSMNSHVKLELQTCSNVSAFVAEACSTVDNMVNIARVASWLRRSSEFRINEGGKLIGRSSYNRHHELQYKISLLIKRLRKTGLIKAS